MPRANRNTWRRRHLPNKKRAPPPPLSGGGPRARPRPLPSDRGPRARRRHLPQPLYKPHMFRTVISPCPSIRTCVSSSNGYSSRCPPPSLSLSLPPSLPPSVRPSPSPSLPPSVSPMSAVPFTPLNVAAQHRGTPTPLSSASVVYPTA
ncbi:unnamed protein product [Boreogadus saida]